MKEGRKFFILPVALLFFLGEAALAVFLVKHFEGKLVTIFICLLAGVLFIVLLLSIFIPPPVEKDCPSCGKEGLKRISSDLPYGIQCPHCGWKDEYRTTAFLDE